MRYRQEFEVWKTAEGLDRLQDFWQAPMAEESIMSTNDNSDPRIIDPDLCEHLLPVEQKFLSL